MWFRLVESILSLLIGAESTITTMLELCVVHSITTTDVVKHSRKTYVIHSLHIHNATDFDDDKNISLRVIFSNENRKCLKIQVTTKRTTSIRISIFTIEKQQIIFHLQKFLVCADGITTSVLICP